MFKHTIKYLKKPVSNTADSVDDDDNDHADDAKDDDEMPWQTT